MKPKKPLEENTGSMLFGISISNRFFFFGSFSSCKDNKNKNKQTGQYQTKKLLYRKQNHQQSEKSV